MLKGSSALESGKRKKKIDVRLTEIKFQSILDLELALGICWTDIIRMRILKGSRMLVVNACERIRVLDQVGAELVKAGNNISLVGEIRQYIK